MTLRTVLLSIQALLQAAEPDDPQDAVVARQYKEDPELYRKTARHWAQVYAGGEFITYLLMSSTSLPSPTISPKSFIFCFFCFFLPSMNYILFIIMYITSTLLPSFPSLHTFISAPKNSKLDNEFEDKLQQLLTMGISEVWS